MNTPYLISQNTRWLLDKAQVAARYIESWAKSNAYKAYRFEKDPNDSFDIE
jgi:hypothetical protein